MKKLLLFFILLWAFSKVHCQKHPNKMDTVTGLWKWDGKLPIVLYGGGADTSTNYVSCGWQTLRHSKDTLYFMKDKYGYFILWHKDSDTLELVPPKFKYIKIGKQNIKL